MDYHDVDEDEAEDSRQRFLERAAGQEQRHEAAPQDEPKYLPADEPGFETEAWTAGGPEEAGA